MSTEPKLEHPEPENAKSPEKTFRILFLDSAENIELLKETCKEVGYVVVGATTIEEAWAFLHGKNHADVIVCAAYLEDESVFEFLKGVRDSDGHAEAMFLILSLEAGSFGSRLEKSTEMAGLALGANGYLIMPRFKPGELLAHIKGLLPKVPMLQQSGTPEEKRDAE
ncbi:MAG: response regulator [Pseudomonadota bacterium]|nr:response regulator [Pseudomonadota bacterium]